MYQNFKILRQLRKKKKHRKERKGGRKSLKKERGEGHKDGRKERREKKGEERYSTQSIQLNTYYHFIHLKNLSYSKEKNLTSITSNLNVIALYIEQMGIKVFDSKAFTGVHTSTKK